MGLFRHLFAGFWRRPRMSDDIHLLVMGMDTLLKQNKRIETMSQALTIELQNVKAQVDDLKVSLNAAAQRDGVHKAALDTALGKIDALTAQLNASPEDTAAQEAALADIRQGLTDAKASVEKLDADNGVAVVSTLPGTGTSPTPTTDPGTAPVGADPAGPGAPSDATSGTQTPDGDSKPAAQGS